MPSARGTVTYYLLQAIEDSRVPITHVEWCETVKPLVARYMEQNYTNKKQTVVMQDDMAEPLVLNP